MDVHAEIRQDRPDHWVGRTVDEAGRPLEVSAPTREECLVRLRRSVVTSAGDGMVVEVVPLMAGVAEAAEVMGWDKRRVITYIDRGRFPAPAQALASGRIWIRADVERFSREWHARRRARRSMNDDH
jgi:hypothetical protein